MSSRQEKQREYAARHSRKEQAKVADIGDVPPVENLERRAASCGDLHLFLRTYFPNSTGLKPFGEDHKRVIHRNQICVLDGGLFLNVMPRGGAKTSIGEGTMIWATLYGHRAFVPVFTADAGAAESIIESIKLELSENDLLYADFPEVIHAIRALEGKPQRCLSQTHHGKLTHIGWRADTIIFPTIEGSIVSGAILTAKGIEGASRGMKHKRADGTQQRPDFVLLDDPQTDGSASTPLQVEKRLSVIRKSILKLGGHNRKIACVMNATVIRPDDLVERLLDASKFPAWQSERVKMVKKWSKSHETLWLTDYARLRNTYDKEVLGDQQRAHGEATKFYRLNRAQMDEGAEVFWEHCLDESTELSAIQHAYNSLIDDGEEVFASECQNEPLKTVIGDSDALTATDILTKLNRSERGKLPTATSRVVAFIDPKKALFYWLVCGIDERFGVHLADFGTFPEQKQAYFSAKQARATIARKFPGMAFEAQIYAALDANVNALMAREWEREDGAKLRLERVLIDANWGEITDVVYQFCRQSPHSAVLMPSHGKYVGASSRSWNEFKAQPGDRVGMHWRMPNVAGRRQVRYVFFDTNWWKSFAASRIRAPMGGPGCLTVFGQPGKDEHRLLVDHLLSEKPHTITDNKTGRTSAEWKHENRLIDNDYWDSLVGCHVAGSIQGASLTERKPETTRTVTFAQRKKERKVWRANAH